MNTETPPPDGPITDFTGTRVLITGGTRGIGAAIARHFGAGGARVVVAARTPVDAPPAGRFVRADVADPHGATALAEQAQDILGGVDVLVNNAGSQSYVPEGVLAMTDEDWSRDLNTNLLSAVRLDRAVLPSMIAQRNGAIVHVASGHAHRPGVGALAYGAAKAAVLSYSKGLADEMGPHGIRVNAVVPGLIETPAAIKRFEEHAQAGGGDLATSRRQYIDAVGIPLRRTGRPEDVARLVAYLASELAGFLTGGRYVVDGGTLPM